ncbi:DUF6779 domain-containing protein [Geodermatophilus sp. URMC 62]|uniref:DUF6779 domain-containing protein n=1 Tax=Geodermatophilus sp. URMC 62 TaxID=3423414 RepID=UPI00406CC79B
MRGDDAATRRAPAAAGSPRLRAAGLTAGCLVALAATAAVFLTDDPQLLRVAVVAVAWACLAAAFAAGRHRGADPSAADAPAADTPAAGSLAADVAAVEAELRSAYDRELEREVAARQQFELELESSLRREAEEAMRAELDALRAELAGLRAGLSGLSGLREELAAVAALRGELAAVAALRGQLEGLGDLRADVGRLRTELTERLSGEMHVERLVMRTQSVRATPGRELLEPATTAWHADVARDLSAGRPVPSRDDRRPQEAPVPTTALPGVDPAPAVHPPPPLRPVPVREEAGGTADDGADDGAALRRRRTDPVGAPLSAPVAAEQLTVERPAVHAAAAGHAAGGWSPAASAAVASQPDDAGSARLAQILAESGVTPGGRRHRYRDEDPGDDVLARVLGR